MNDSIALTIRPSKMLSLASRLTVVLLAMTGGSIAQAQTGGDLPDATVRATRGVFIPGATRTGDADATAVELNAAQLAWLRGGALTFVADWWRTEAAMPGRGAALFLAGPMWSAGGVGIGLQRLGGTVGDGAQPARTKFQLAYGVGSRRVGIGATWAHLFGGAFGGTDTFDVGAAWRASSRLAFGFVAEDVARPRLGNAPDPLPRRWVGEVALRPAGTDSFELAAAALHLSDDRWSRLAARFRLVAKTWGGIGLLADLELAPRRAIVPPLPGATGDTGMDWRATFGIALAFDHARMIVAGRRSFTPPGLPGENWGGSFVLHTSTERTAGAVGAGYVARVTFDGVDSDREFLNLALRLRALATDRAVAAVFLKVEDVDVGLGRVEELRDLVGEIQRAGKRVIAYVTQPSLKDLYLASACDKIVIHPAGELTFAGMAQSVTMYKGAMDRLGVSVDLVRIAEYKGAMEPYVMTGLSGPVRQNRNDLLDDVFGRVLAAVAEGRTAARQRAAAESPVPLAGPLDVARLGQLVSIGSFTPEEAKNAGLVDAIRDHEEVKDYVRDYLGMGSLEMRAPDVAPTRSIRWVRPRVAVILVDGTITDGSSQGLPLALGGVAGADTLTAALDECRRDADVRAVVLRVNSPGGSAFSSDVIARAVTRVRAAGKPVVTSMGDVAASGGYYVAAPTNVIFAEPSTTTGSIGIFGFKIDVSRLLSFLSINVEVLRRGAHADQQSPYRPWTAEERAMAEQKIRHLYELFTTTVAEGRKSRGFTKARVDEVGRGHVWTGAQALRLGLVDDVGGVTAAIDRAASLGGVPRRFGEAPDLLVLPRPGQSIVESIVGLAAVDTSSPLPGGTAGQGAAARLTPPLRAALKLAAPYLLGPGEGVEARLPFDLDVR